MSIPACHIVISCGPGYVIKSSRLKSYFAYICHMKCLLYPETKPQIHNFINIDNLSIITVFYYIAVFSYGTRLELRNNITVFGWLYSPFCYNVLFLYDVGYFQNYMTYNIHKDHNRIFTICEKTCAYLKLA